MASRCNASDAGSRLGGPDGELNQLEDIILGKVQQKVPSRMSEDSFIIKGCRHQDLGESGFIDFNQFKRAFAAFTTGIADQDIRLIFDRYATNGALQYKLFAADFVRGTLRERSAGMPLGSEAVNEQQWESPEELLARMKAFICGQGMRAVIGLAAAFRDQDPENVRAVGPDEFQDVIAGAFSTETGCLVHEVQVGHLFDFFQQPFCPGQIAYDDFLQVFKDEPLTAARREVVRGSFRRLDSDSEGLVDVNKIMRMYNTARHPQVCDGSRQADEVFDEFADTFRECIAYRRGQRSYPTNLIAWEEYEDYWKFISACFDSDAFFCSVLQRVWDLDKAPNSSIESRASLARPAAGLAAKSRAGLHHWQSDTLPSSVTHNTVSAPIQVGAVLERARGNIAKRGMRAAVDVVKNFYAADDDVDDLLDVYEFRKACQQSGITLRDAEEQVCFDACGVDPTGGQRRGRLMHLQRFLNMLHGGLPAPRRDLVERAFRSLGGDPADQGSTISPGTLKQSFCAEAHPLVVKGEMDAGVLLGEFLDTFSLLAHVRGGCENGQVAFTDFLAFYEVVSSTIESDVLFDLLMHRLWPIDAQTLEDQRQAEDCRGRDATPPRSPSKRDRWAAPVYEAGDQAVPRQRPPAFDGTSCYARPATAPAVEAPPVPDTHRRFARTAVCAPPPQEGAGMNQSYAVAGGPAAGYSAITRSSIVFNEAGTSGLAPVLRGLRGSIAKRGLKGWRLLSERFAQHDFRKNGGIMRSDWQRMHKSLGLGLSPEEQEVIFRTFSQGRKDGSMDSRECFRAIRGPLDDRRLALVKRLFDHLSHGQGTVFDSSLKERFDAKSTPLCLVGSKDARSERQEFDEAVDHFAGGKGLDGEGFVNFFAMLSAMYPEEDEFKLIATTVFGIRDANYGGC